MLHANNMTKLTDDSAAISRLQKGDMTGKQILEYFQTMILKVGPQTLSDGEFAKASESFRPITSARIILSGRLSIT